MTLAVGTTQPSAPPPSPYARAGDLVSVLLIGALGVAVVYFIIKYAVLGALRRYAKERQP